MHTAISAARTIADRIASLETGPQLDRAVGEFADVLKAVPNLGVADLTPADHDALTTLAELVIDRIEDRLAVHHDRASIQQNLAAAIYRIRRELEEIDRWLRHRHSTPGPISGRAS
jgi:hypothetical protein